MARQVLGAALKELKRADCSASIGTVMKCLYWWLACLGLVTGCSSFSHHRPEPESLQQEASRETVVNVENALKEREQSALQAKNDLLRSAPREREARFGEYLTAQESRIEAAEKLTTLLTAVQDGDSRYPSSEQLQSEATKKLAKLSDHRQRCQDEIRQVYVKAFPDLSPPLRSDILEGKVRVGMTPQQARIAWGKPLKVNLLQANSSVTEEWLYLNRNALYFDNGKLSSFDGGR